MRRECGEERYENEDEGSRLWEGKEDLDLPRSEAHHDVAVSSSSAGAPVVVNVSTGTGDGGIANTAWKEEDKER